MNMPLTVDRSSQAMILVVDDDPDNLLLLTHQVSLLIDCSVTNATDGFSALSLAKELQPDLILLDIMLPDIDGFQVVHRLKQDPLTRSIPVVAVTAMARLQDEELALQAGYDDYLRKPYELESLETVIYRYLSASCPLSS
ncbi:response regulator [Kovacikia minuta CCNUW1]|uniref:response regulator n=1 Tax=Kovacikia minuta TaxID=2931930 RepID=UPI001CCC1EF4|nr:response regulator [Kovacikia minuta]UBF24654.1 response regulator [Kovacikia minuta CCNUW1]